MRHSGFRLLMIAVLLFTMLSSVNSFELFNETSDYGFLMENKINIQEEVADISLFSEIVTDYSVSSKQLELKPVNIYFNDEIVFVSGNLSEVSYKLNNTLLYPGTVSMVTAYTGFEVKNLMMELRGDNSANDISGLRGGWLRFRSLYKQLLFI